MSELEVQNQSAVYYEKRYSGFGLRYHKIIIDWMMEGVWPDQIVLDAGCGTGIIERIYSTHTIHGVDISQKMIKRCPTFLRPAIALADGRIARVLDKPCWVSDVTNLQVLPDVKLYDVVVCRSLLHHLENHKMALSEFYRVLKPGGRLVAWETNKGLIANWVRSKTQHGDRFSEYHHAFKPGELEQDIKDAGFDIEEVRYMGFVAYCWAGFPDIVNFAKWTPFKPLVYRVLLGLDYIIESTPILRKVCFSVGIKARKL